MRAALLSLVLLAFAGDAVAEPPARAAFALIIGVNDGIPGLPALRYADDDAAQYLGLFRALGADARVLASLDENTARVQPQAAAEARPPTPAEVDRAVAELAADVARARAQGIDTVLYVVYAGHGDLDDDGRAFLGLHGGRLGGADLLALVAAIGADRSHLIIDACYADLLVQPRGPGGRRRAFAGFTRGALPEVPASVGLLLSTSSGRESHEWEGVQGGIFSHEVRSGLYGAADADGDGAVSYREIAAFIEQANAAIPNERFRPDVLVRPPATSAELLALGTGLDRRIVIAPSVQGHYVLEDSDGVRVLEFHGGAGATTTLVRPPGELALYLTRVSDDVEYALPAQAVVEVAALAPATAAAHARGAAHDSFSLLFALPFDAVVVRDFTPHLEVVDEGPTPLARRRRAGWIILGVGGATAASAAIVELAALALRSGARDASQRDVATANHRIDALNTTAGVLTGVAATAIVGGALLVIWPGAPPAAVDVGPGWASVSLSGTF